MPTIIAARSATPTNTPDFIELFIVALPKKELPILRGANETTGGVHQCRWETRSFCQGLMSNRLASGLLRSFATLNMPLFRGRPTEHGYFPGFRRFWGRAELLESGSQVWPLAADES
jgi:hypothetical protein